MISQQTPKRCCEVSVSADETIYHQKEIDKTLLFLYYVNNHFIFFLLLRAVRGFQYSGLHFLFSMIQSDE